MQALDYISFPLKEAKTMMISNSLFWSLAILQFIFTWWERRKVMLLLLRWVLLVMNVELLLCRMCVKLSSRLSECGIQLCGLPLVKQQSLQPEECFKPSSLVFSGLGNKRIFISTNPNLIRKGNIMLLHESMRFLPKPNMYRTLKKYSTDSFPFDLFVSPPFFQCRVHN